MASSNRGLMLDDLIPAAGDDGYGLAGVSVRRGSGDDLHLDPRYSSQLPFVFERMSPQPSARERIIRDGKFAAGSAPFGFAGPGSLNFDGRADAAARNLNRFRVAPQQFISQEPLTFSDLNGFTRAVANGLPIVGAYNNNVEASIEAAGAPILNPLVAPEDRLTEPAFHDRYTHALDVQNKYDEDFERRHPNLKWAGNTLGGILGTSALLGIAPWMGPIVTRNQVLRGAGTAGALWGADAAVRGGSPGDDVESGVKHGTFNALARTGLNVLKNMIRPF